MKFVSEILYLLKKNFSGAVDFYIEDIGDIDPETGTRVITRPKTRVRKTIILDSRAMLKYLGRNEGFFSQEIRFFIFEKKDAPSFTPTLDHYAIYKNRRYQLKEIKEFEFQRAYLLMGLETPLERIYQEHEAKLTQSIEFEQEAVYE